jgi:hypothetical protein
MTVLLIPPIADADAHQQVELALNPRAMRPYLLHTGAAQQSASRSANVCQVLDAKYEPGARCAILYQLGERLVIGELQWNEMASGTLDAAGDVHPPAMQIYAFEDDPALSALRTVLDSQQMARILSQALPECAASVSSIVRCQVTPLRYRLGKRCTLRIDFRLRNRKSGAIIARTLYGKLYHSVSKAQAVYGEMQMLAAAPALCAAGVQLARVAAFVPELPMVFQEPVAGMPLDLILSQPRRTTLAWGAGAWAGIHGAAEALAALHQGDTSTSRMRPVAAELERMQRRSERIMQVDPTIGAALNELARALPVWLDRLPDWGAESCLVHGDCKPSQFLITPAAQGDSGAARVALLDFDHCGMADPASDVGNFLASLRQAGVAQALRVGASSGTAVQERWPAALEEEFLTSYLAAGCCPPALRLRATWYQASPPAQGTAQLCAQSALTTTRPPGARGVALPGEVAGFCLISFPSSAD